MRLKKELRAIFSIIDNHYFVVKNKKATFMICTPFLGQINKRPKLTNLPNASDINSEAFF